MAHSPRKQSMKKNLKKNTYSQLVKDITELYDQARRALVEAYWRIGKRIVEQEQEGEAHAVYGDHLLKRLSEDLSGSLGSGFSERNLRNLRMIQATVFSHSPVSTPRHIFTGL